MKFNIPNLMALMAIASTHVVGSFSICTDGSTGTELVVSYTSEGFFTFSVNNLPPDSGDCVVRMISWNGVPVDVASAQTDCNSFPSLSADSGLGLSRFEFGQRFSFQLETSLCQTPVVSVAPPLCRGSGYALSSLRVQKRPFDSILASFVSPPLQGKCVAILSSWGGSAQHGVWRESDCQSPVSFVADTFLADTVYSVGMVQMSPFADIAYDQPLCGVNPVSVTPVSCPSTSLEITQSGGSAVDVKVHGQKRYCQLTAGWWSSFNVTIGAAIVKRSDECNPTRFLETEMGHPFEFGGTYTFELSVFTDASYSQLRCFTIGTRTIAPPSLAGVTGSWSRPDALHVQLRLVDAPSVGICQISISAPVTETVVNDCRSAFVFTSPSGFTANGLLSASVVFFRSGRIEGVGSSAVTLQYDPVEDYAPAAPTLIVRNEVRIFRIPDPRPLTASCNLVISGCVVLEVAFGSCHSALRLTMADLAGASLGVQCFATYQVTSSLGITPFAVTTSASKDFYVQAKLLLSLVSSTSTSLTLSVNPLPGAVTAAAASPECVFTVLQCDGIPATSFAAQTNCVDNAELANFLSFDQVCTVQAAVYAGTDRTHVLGLSDRVLFKVSDPPSWPMDPVISVSASGANCRRIAWVAPLPSGAPLQCFELSLYSTVIATCTLARWFVDCTQFADGTALVYAVRARNQVGWSVALVANQVKPEWLLVTDSVTLTSPTASVSAAGAFPNVTVVDSTSATGGRFFVASLVARSGLDADTRSVAVDLLNGDAGYVAGLPMVGGNFPTVFTKKLDPTGTLGEYSFVGGSAPSGLHSLIVYSLSQGGVRMLSWTNAELVGPAVDDAKVTSVNQAWAAEEAASRRWVGFMSPEFSETYTFSLETFEKARLWINGNLVISEWASGCFYLCRGSFAVTAGEIYHVRLEIAVRTRLPRARLLWSSRSLARQAVPPERLFYALAVSATPFHLSVIPGAADATLSTYSVSSSSVTAGDSFAVSVTGKDEFGNIVPPAAGTFTVALSTGIVQGGACAEASGGASFACSVAVKGTYDVTVSLVGGLSLSPPLQIFVVAGSPTHVASFTSSVSEGTAVVSFTLADANGNTVTGAVAGVKVQADRVGYGSIPQLAVDDLALRERRYPTFVSTEAITVTGNTYRASLSLPIAGHYEVVVVLNNVNQAPREVIVPASSASVGPNAVITSIPFPPTVLRAGEEKSFLVQLRDVAGNVITTSSPVSPSVSVALSRVAGSCTDTATVGELSCSISPELAGTDSLRITVDGAFASYLELVGADVVSRPGPWKVTVAPGSPDGSKCKLTGIKPVYTAGIKAVAILTLFDAFGNKVTALDMDPAVDVRFTKEGVAPLVVTEQFTYSQMSGTIELPILTNSVITGATLAITVEGTTVPMPAGISTVDVYRDRVDAVGSTCDVIGNIPVNDFLFVSCVLRDHVGNEANVAGIVVTTTILEPDSVTTQLTLEQFDGSTYFSQGMQRTDQGTFEYFTTIRQPGGLMAKYYSGNNYSGLLPDAQVEDPLEDHRAYADGPIYYTRIDNFVTFQAPVDLHGQTVVSVRWIGSVKAPITGDVVFSLVGTGGGTVGLSLDGQGVLGDLGDSTPYTMTLDMLVDIEVTYVPSATSTLKLMWSYTGRASHVIPSSALFVELNNNPLGSFTFNVVPGSVF